MDGEIGLAKACNIYRQTARCAHVP